MACPTSLEFTFTVRLHLLLLFQIKFIIIYIQFSIIVSGIFVTHSIKFLVKFLCFYFYCIKLIDLMYVCTVMHVHRRHHSV